MHIKNEQKIVLCHSTYIFPSKIQVPNKHSFDYQIYDKFKKLLLEYQKLLNQNINLSDQAVHYGLQFLNHMVIPKSMNMSQNIFTVVFSKILRVYSSQYQMIASRLKLMVTLTNRWLQHCYYKCLHNKSIIEWSVHLNTVDSRKRNIQIIRS